MTTSSFSSSELISLILTSLPSDIAHAELSVTTVSTCCHKRCVYFPAVSVSVACQPNRFIFISIFGNNSMGIPRKAILPFISRKFFSYYNQRRQSIYSFVNVPPKTPPLFTPCPLTASAAALCFPPTATLVLHFNRICISTLRYSLECKNPQTTNRKKVALKKLQLQMHLLWDVICSHYASKTKYEN